MKSKSLLAIGIILVCLFYLSGDIYTLVDYFQIVQVEEEPIMNFGPSPFMMYAFAILFLLKILLLLKAYSVSDYLLRAGGEETILGLDMNNILLLIGILIFIVEMPALIMSIIKYKSTISYVDDPYKAFTEKLDIYDSSIKLLFAFVLIYWRKDILNKLTHKSE